MGHILRNQYKYLQAVITCVEASAKIAKINDSLFELVFTVLFLIIERDELFYSCRQNYIVLCLLCCLCCLVGAKPLFGTNAEIVVNWNLKNKLQWNFNRNSYIFIQENTFETVVCGIAAMLSRPHCVKNKHSHNDSLHQRWFSRSWCSKTCSTNTHLPNDFRLVC